jgi:hypothetical protein
MGTGVTLSTESPENLKAEVRGQRLEVSKTLSLGTLSSTERS